MKRRIAAVLAALALALTACSASGEAGSKGSGKAVTVGLTYVPDIQFAPFYVAKEKGYFTREGVNVTLRHHGAQESLLGALEAGHEDVVFAGGDEMMRGRSNGLDVVDWATMYQKYPVALIVPEDSPIRTPADLRGRTVGLPGQQGENYFTLRAMFKAYGLSEKDVKVQYIGYTQSAALSAKRVDAVIGFTNSDAVALQTAGMKVRTVSPVADGLPLVGVGLGSKSANLRTNRQAYRKMLTALDKAVAYCREHPDDVLAITRKHVPALATPQRRAAAKATLARTLELYTASGAFGSQNAGTWTAMSSFMQDNGLLSKPVPAADAYTDLTK